MYSLKEVHLYRMKDKSITPIQKDLKLNALEGLSYPASQDIYNQSKNEVNLDPENPSTLKTANEPMVEGNKNEKSFSEDVSGNDLDIPGAELDDEQEKTGSEDEENNGYSLGGERHKALEEDNDNNTL